MCGRHFASRAATVKLSDVIGRSLVDLPLHVNPGRASRVITSTWEQHLIGYRCNIRRNRFDRYSQDNFRPSDNLHP